MIRKVLLSVFLVLVISAGQSSLSGFSSKTGRSVYIDSFDYQTAQYFYAVKNAVDDENDVINICLYDIGKNDLTYVFPSDNRDVIIGFYYQIGYKTDENRMLLFPRDSIAQYRVLPSSVDPQKASLNMIIITYSKTSKLKTLWICGKVGSGLKKLAEYDDKTRLEIDTMFNKILLIKQEGNKLKIDSNNY